ncbi:MAG: glycosyltransferase, partial [Usitatibacter sp.]
VLARELTALLTDTHARRRMGEAARRSARERFSADVLVPRLEALWSGIVSGAPASGNWRFRPR